MSPRPAVHLGYLEQANLQQGSQMAGVYSSGSATAYGTTNMTTFGNTGYATMNVMATTARLSRPLRASDIGADRPAPSQPASKSVGLAMANGRVAASVVEHKFAAVGCGCHGLQPASTAILSPIRPRLRRTLSAFRAAQPMERTSCTERSPGSSETLTDGSCRKRSIGHPE
jgi:hypothetical protein